MFTTLHSATHAELGRLTGILLGRKAQYFRGKILNSWLWNCWIVERKNRTGKGVNIFNMF